MLRCTFCECSIAVSGRTDKPPYVCVSLPRVQMGGPLVAIRLGRRDGVISRASEVAIIPSSHANISALIPDLRRMRLSPMDMVTLTGQPTVAFRGTVQQDTVQYSTVQYSTVQYRTVHKRQNSKLL